MNDRNSPCSCGSGKKYKYCCGDPKTMIPVEPEKKPKALTPNGFLRIIWLMLNEQEVKEITVPCQMLDSMPVGSNLNVNYNAERDEFTLSAVEETVQGSSVVEVPRRNLIVPN